MSGFDSICALLRARSGLSLGPDKRYLMESRLGPLMHRLGLPNLTVLHERLRADRSLEQQVVEAMTTNETLFFRDGKPFDHLRQSVLPRLHAARPAGDRLRIWSAAASTGQEAYSIAMLVRELSPLLAAREVEIVGTDIAREALQRAEEGLYSQFEVQRGLPPAMLLKYFRREDAGWRIVSAIRGMVRFHCWNLLSDPTPLGRFDVVFCRNVLIYFDQPTKARIITALEHRLAEDGLLVLGGAETLLGMQSALCGVPGLPGLFTRPAPAGRAPVNPVRTIVSAESAGVPADH